MKRFKQIFERVFFLPPLPTLLFALAGYALVIGVFALQVENPVIQIFAYLASAYALVVSITGLPHLVAFLRDAVRWALELRPVRWFLATEFGARFFGDIHFRAEVALYRGFFINLLYIIMKLVYGILYRSVWFIALAFYYILLAVARFMLFRRTPDYATMATRLRRYRACGILLLVINQALTGVVVFIVHQNRSFNYPGLLIYGMAIYAFYAIGSSVVNVVKFRNRGNPILSASKVVSLVSAMVSMLSLTTAMLARYNGDAEDFRVLMTGTVGGFVCVTVIAMAVYMIVKGNHELKKLENS